MVEVIAAYTLFILMAAVPTLVPVLAIALPAQAAWLATRGYRVLPVICLVLAGYCAMLAFGPAGAVPGGEAFQALRKSAERQQFARKMMGSSTFGGSGKPATVGEIMAVYGEPAKPGSSGADDTRSAQAAPEARPEREPRGDEPMVDPTPTM